MNLYGPKRFAIGSGVNQAIRQLGAVLGVALAITLLGKDPRNAPVSAFDHVFALYAAGGLLTAAVSLGVRTKSLVARQTGVRAQIQAVDT